MKKIISLFAALLIVLTVNTAYAKTYSDKDIKLIARVVEGEAKNQPFLGKAAVALTVINRYESGKYGSSLTRITRRSQFYKARKAGKASVEAVKWALENRILPVNTFYFQRSKKATWGKRPTIKRYTRIGHHTFYTLGNPNMPSGLQYVTETGNLYTKAG